MDGTSMNRWLVPTIVVVAIVFAASVFILFVLSFRSHPEGTALVPDEYMTGLAIPQFTLTDADGRPATQAIFDGRVTIVDFIFTNCPFICPTMTAAIERLQEQLTGTTVQFVSVSVDPKHDTPERLKEYAAAHNADPARWKFLTGDFAIVEKIVRDALMFELSVDDKTRFNTSDGKEEMSNITHPPKLVLIGPKREVLAMYEPNFDEDIARLAERARAAAAQLKR